MILSIIFLIFTAIFGIISFHKTTPFKEQHTKELVKSIYGYARVFGYLPKENLFNQIGISESFFFQHYEYVANEIFTNQQLISFDSIETILRKSEYQTINTINQTHVATLKSKYIIIEISKENLLNQKDFNKKIHKNFVWIMHQSLPNYKALVYGDWL